MRDLTVCSPILDWYRCKIKSCITFCHYPSLHPIVLWWKCDNDASWYRFFHISKLNISSQIQALLNKQHICFKQFDHLRRRYTEDFFLSVTWSTFSAGFSRRKHWNREGGIHNIDLQHRLLITSTYLVSLFTSKHIHRPQDFVLSRRDYQIAKSATEFRTWVR